MSASHVVDDIYQGCVPALLPFLVAERHYTYAAVSGLTLAATVLSSVAQPAFGWWTDRRPRRWMIPVGMSTAGIGVALSGLSTSYLLTWLAFALSGLGIAAFHPEGARAARQAAGNSTRAMSVFALGGNTGFAIGPLFATPVLLATGVRGTGLLVVPAAVMAVVLVTRLNRVLDGAGGRHRDARLPTGTDDWPLFLRLTAVVMVRSVLFFGLTAFLGLVLATSQPLALVFVVLTGAAVYLPFSVFVMLGQDYLPNRIGTASGVTVGLAVSVGGLASPLLGVLADSASLRVALSALLVLPVLALLLATRLREPAAAPARAPADRTAA